MQNASSSLTNQPTPPFSLLMSASSEEVRRWAHWDGADGSSRQQLLLSLQSMSNPPQFNTQIYTHTHSHPKPTFLRQQWFLQGDSMFSWNRHVNSSAIRVSITILQIPSRYILIMLVGERGSRQSQRLSSSIPMRYGISGGAIMVNISPQLRPIRRLSFGE